MASTDPKIATQGQWEDLADRVKSKAEIGTVLSTPSSVAYVGTNNIIDGAVTSNKIDFTTFTGDYMPIATRTCQYPYAPSSESIKLSRVGNIVFALVNVVVTNVPALDGGSLVETIPSGFRPAPDTQGLIILNSIVGLSTDMSLLISANGGMAMSNRSAIQNSATRLYGQGCWITADAWPS